MKFLNNYWAETATSVKKIALALRTFVGTITASAYVQGNVQLAFYILLVGAIIDFLLNFLPPDKPGNSGTPSIPQINLGTAVIFILALFITSCSIIKPQVNTIQKDSTYTTFKPIEENCENYEGQLLTPYLTHVHTPAGKWLHSPFTHVSTVHSSLSSQSGM